MIGWVIFELRGVSYRVSESQKKERLQRTTCKGKDLSSSVVHGCFLVSRGAPFSGGFNDEESGEGGTAWGSRGCDGGGGGCW